MNKVVNFKIAVALLVAAFLSGICSAAETITLETLLDEMLDRGQLARLDSPAYTCRQFSSYDRGAVAPDQPGWFANGDQSQFLRTETTAGREEQVMMDTEGPGAIVRWWLTMAGEGSGKGTLRVYLDGAPEPAIEGNVFDIMSRGKLAGAPLSMGVSPDTDELRRGHDLYLPIPYARSCKVTFEKEEAGAFYYQINYRTYEAEAKVESYSPAVRQRADEAVSRTREKLAACDRSGAGDFQDAPLAGTIAAGKSASATFAGPACLRGLSLRLQADDLEQALRSTVLRIAFDGKETVWCPAGDFFGTGHQLHPYRSWYTEVSGDGTLACFWVMPFAKSAIVTLENVGSQPVEVTGAKVATGPWEWDGDSLVFHSTWRQLYKAETPGKTGCDVNFVTVTGQGKYAGDTLTIFNGSGAWWGEGDEKIFVDGESFPSHFGTGTEDYYGYAWCRAEPFATPFIALPCGDGNGGKAPGFSVNCRWRALDAIPFEKRFQFDMELWHWAKTKINFAPATFFYARPGAEVSVPPDPEQAALPVAKERADLVPMFQLPGAIEGETMKIRSVTGGKTQVQKIAQFADSWSREQQLWWMDAAEGDKLTLEFPAEKSGVRPVKARLTLARDYGTATIRLNGAVLKENLNFYDPDLLCRDFDLGKAEIKETGNVLEIEITGSDPKAIPRRMVGLDCLVIE